MSRGLLLPSLESLLTSHILHFTFRFISPLRPTTFLSLSLSFPLLSSSSPPHSPHPHPSAHSRACPRSFDPTSRAGALPGYSLSHLKLVDFSTFRLFALQPCHPVIYFLVDPSVGFSLTFYSHLTFCPSRLPLTSPLPSLPSIACTSPLAHGRWVTRIHPMPIDHHPDFSRRHGSSYG